MPGTEFIHPMIVHFPIALILVGFLFEVFGVLAKKDFYSKSAFLLLLLGAAGVVVAYITGSRAGDGLSEVGSLKQAIESHEDSALVTLVLIGSVAAARIVMVSTKRFAGALRWITLTLYLVGVLSIIRTGHLGGTLVYRHAAGVQLQIEEEPSTEETPQ